MTSDDTQPPPHVSIANQIIDLANAGLEGGHAAEDIAEGMRHAAANFSAYAFFRSEALPKDPNVPVDNFVQFFEYYLDVHKPKSTAAEGLNQTIAQAIKEL